LSIGNQKNKRESFFSFIFDLVSKVPFALCIIELVKVVS